MSKQRTFIMSIEIEEFAKVLVERVRDLAIQANERMFAQEHVIAQRWKEAAAAGSFEEFARIIVPDVVGSTISHLLGAIDQEFLRISFTASNGKSVDLTAFAKESGELSGWYSGGGGWCEMYSKERFVDDFTDLNDFFNKPPDAE